MSHLSHRDHVNAFIAKRAPIDFYEDEVSRALELLEAEQKKEREQQQVVMDTMRENGQ